MEDKFWQSFLRTSSETRPTEDDMGIPRYFIINLKSKTIFKIRRAILLFTLLLGSEEMISLAIIKLQNKN